MEQRQVLYALTTIVLWGFWGFFGKLALRHGMPPIFLFAAEILISFVVVGVVLFTMHDWRAMLQTWNGYGIASGLALSLGLLFYYLLLQHGQVTVVVPFTAAYPMVASILALAFLDEKLRPIQWAGLALTMVGLGLLLSSGLSSER